MITRNNERFQIIATELLKHGALPNIQNILGQTALHSALTADMIILLLKHGADATILDNDCKSPLDYNIHNPHIIELLVRPSFRVYPKKINYSITLWVY